MEKSVFSPIPLKLGEKIQLCAGDACYEASLIGCIRGVSLLVSSPMMEGLRIDFLEGEPLEVRMFSGKDILSFATRVMHVCIFPVHYLHLAYPGETRIQPLRHTPWVRVKLPAMVHAGGRIQPVLMVDLSEEGAKLDIPFDMRKDGERMGVSFDAEVDEFRREMNLEARIEHVTEGKEMFEYGVSFLGVSQEDRLWLKCLVYKRMAEGHLI
ncbi:MAG TPA: flagellar brake protein [Burkholderiales bacterium]|nr:flagellar brake protein [Burkholderiales bacterium]